ncbi:hypothetical protein V8C34DRAFT_249603 [Trichoderma compactum]
MALLGLLELLDLPGGSSQVEYSFHLSGSYGNVMTGLRLPIVSKYIASKKEVYCKHSSTCMRPDVQGTAFTK